MASLVVVVPAENPWNSAYWYIRAETTLTGYFEGAA